MFEFSQEQLDNAALALDAYNKRMFDLWRRAKHPETGRSLGSEPSMIAVMAILEAVQFVIMAMADAKASRQSVQ